MGQKERDELLANFTAPGVAAYIGGVNLREAVFLVVKSATMIDETNERLSKSNEKLTKVNIALAVVVVVLTVVQVLIRGLSALPAVSLVTRPHPSRCEAASSAPASRVTT